MTYCYSCHLTHGGDLCPICQLRAELRASLKIARTNAQLSMVDTEATH